MKSPRFSGKPRKRKPLLFRRIVGDSMLPTYREGQIVIASGWFRKLQSQDVVIIGHGGLEKIKRINRIEEDKIYVVGDNLAASTDSRDFGWLPLIAVRAKVILPRQ